MLEPPSMEPPSTEPPGIEPPGIEPPGAEPARGRSNKRLGISIAVGIALGAVIGAVTRNMIWVAWGAPFGVASYWLTRLFGMLTRPRSPARRSSVVCWRRGRPPGDAEQ